MKKKLYQPKPINLENHGNNKRISGRLQTLKEKLEKLHMNVVNLSIAFTCRARWSKVEDCPEPDDIKIDQDVLQKSQNCEIA